METTHAKVLRLHMNEPGGDTADPTACYPETGALVAELATLHAVAPGNILVTPGADGAIEAACRVTRGSLMVLDPDFPRYRYHAQHANLPVYAVSTSCPPVHFPVERLLGAISPDVGTIILSTVGNPTGYQLPAPGFVDALRHQAPLALIVVDEVYSPFIGVDYTSLAAKTPGMLSIRSLSKVGYPGLRVGYAVGHPATLAKLAPFVSPYAIAGPSLIGACAAIRQHALWDATIRRQAAARTWLVDQLNARGFTCHPSPANWVLLQLGTRARPVAHALDERGILVQRLNHPMLAGYLRISTPSLPAMEHFVHALDMLVDTECDSLEDYCYA